MRILRGSLYNAWAHWLRELWPIVFYEITPAFYILGHKPVVESRSLLGVVVGDVLEGNEDVYQSSCHSKSFIAESDIDQRHGGLSNREALRVKRQSHAVAVRIERRVVRGLIHTQLRVGDELSDVLYLGALALASRVAHAPMISFGSSTQ